jgi:hypothetical protein
MATIGSGVGAADHARATVAPQMAPRSRALTARKTWRRFFG